MRELTTQQATVLDVLHRWRREGALYTSDIAYGAKMNTARAFRALEALEKRGAVKRVVKGMPTSWALAEGPQP